MNESSPALTLTAEIVASEGVAVARMRGEIDVLTAPEFHTAIESATSRYPGSVLVVDLTEVTFLASAGLAVLARSSDDTEGRRFLVVATGPATLRPLQLTGLADSLEVFPSLEAALATV